MTNTETQTLRPTRQAAHQHEAVNGEQETGEIAEQGSVGEPRPEDALVPSGKVGSEEQAAQRAGADHGPARKGPAAALPKRDEDEERKGKG